MLLSIVCVEDIHTSCKLFMTAEHTMFTHSSVVPIQSVLVSKLFVHLVYMFLFCRHVC